MNNLFYSSKEMYSSTQLIRHSKDIFDKIVNNEIDKAVILRDGKPAFMLVDFEKYEKFMNDYNNLIATLNTNNDTNNNTTTIQTEETKKVETPLKIVEEKQQKVNPAKVVPPTPKVEVEEYEEEDEIDEEDGIDVQENLKEDIDEDKKHNPDLLDDFGFDDEFKAEVARRLEEKNKLNQANTFNNRFEKKENKPAEIKEFWA